MSAEIYYGDDFAVDLQYFNYRIVTPDWKIPESIIDFMDLTYILKGELEYSINHIPHHLCAGDLLFIPPGNLRSARPLTSEPAEGLALNFRAYLQNGSEIVLPFPLISHIGEHMELKPYYEEINKALLTKEPGYRLKVQAFTLLTLQNFQQIVFFQNNASISDRRIQLSMEYIVSHFNEPLKVSEIAQMFNLSPVYFGNLFKQQTGRSFHQYLNFIRLNHAEDMLRIGTYNVSEVAEQCGFSDVFYFSRLYKAAKGISPSKIIAPKRV